MRVRLGSVLAVFCAISGFGCSSHREPPTPEGYCGDKTASLLAAAGAPLVPTDPLSEEPVDGSACNAVLRTYPIESATHVETCSPVSYGTNPPSSGHHYPLFPKFGVYEYAIPRGFWVHSLEHGGVVTTYSCHDCPGEVAAATELVETLEIEPACCSGGSCDNETNRMSLTPDAGIPTAWAASAWGFTLTADCFEPDVFKAFAEEHRGLGPEQICSNEYATDVTK